MVAFEDFPSGPPIDSYDEEPVRLDDHRPRAATDEPVVVDTLPKRIHLPYTDLGNARRFDLLYGADARWCDARERWLAWDGSRWAWDDRRAVHAMCQGTVDRIIDELQFWRGELEGCTEPEERVKLEARIKACGKHWASSQSSGRIGAVANEARALPSRAVAMQDLDAEAWVFNAANVTINLRTDEVYPHRRSDLITHRGGVDYVEFAGCPTWEAFLRQIMQDQGDIIAFLRRSAGYCLTGDVSEQKFWVLLGDGANGKSTFLEILMWVLGTYAKPLAPGFLEQKRHDDSHPTDVADLQGARFTASSEVRQGKSLNESKVKRLTGGDQVKARFMNQDFFFFEPTHKLWLATNHKLRVRGTDHGIWRRTMVVPFKVQIPESEQDPHLKDKLKAEGPGILNWALQGLREWRTTRLAPPAAVIEAVQDYRETEDIVAAWLEDCCTADPNTETTVADLYRAYSAWFEAAGHTGRPMASRELSEALGKRGFGDRKGGKGVRYRTGIRLEASAVRAPSDWPKDRFGDGD